MNTRDLVSEGSSSPDVENKVFRILAVYDSVESSREAARASAVVLRELGEDVIVHRNSWDSEALEDGTFLADFNLAYNPYCAYSDN